VLDHYIYNESKAVRNTKRYYVTDVSLVIEPFMYNK